MLHNASWKTVRLEGITSKIGSGATPRGGKESYQHTGISLIRSLNVYDFYFVKDGLAHIDDDQAAQLAGVTVEPDDILLNITGASVARCCMVPPDVLPARVNQHVAIVRVKKGVADPAFVFYCLNSPQYKSQLLALAQGGATREALTKETIENFQVSLPAISVQQRLSSVLRAYDDLIKNNTRRIKVLEEMSRMTYREWFVDLRFPGHQQAKLIKSGHGLLPEGWQLQTLGDVTSVVTKGTTPTTLGKQFQNTGINFVKIESIGESGAMSIDKMARIDAETHELLKRSQLRKDDILFSIAGAIGRVSLVTERILPANTNQALAIIRCSNPVSVAYLLMTIRSERFLNFSLGRVVQTAQANVSLSILKSAPIVIPPDLTMSSFNDVTYPQLKLVDCLLSKNDNLRRTRDLILPKVISGEISVEQFDAEAVAQGV